MKISREEVEHVAHLARLALEPREADEFTGQLDDILAYFEKLNEPDTTEVEPMQHALNIVNAFREDEVRESYDAKTALRNAPDPENNFFKVPKIIE
ncbi:MAG: Asp-tRNA(Asn)/Glu-tRNA(Gln) amidotransferase subunit GatC [bacterium]